MAYWELNGHVTDDVMCSWKVKVMIPICSQRNILKMAGN